MPFLLFEARNDNQLILPRKAVENLVSRFDHDFPEYVRALPAIYDIESRECHCGREDCEIFLSSFEDAPVVETVPVEIPVTTPEVANVIAIANEANAVRTENTVPMANAVANVTTTAATETIPKKKPTTRKRKTAVETK